MMTANETLAIVLALAERQPWMVECSQCGGTSWIKQKPGALGFGSMLCDRCNPDPRKLDHSPTKGKVPNARKQAVLALVTVPCEGWYESNFTECLCGGDEPQCDIGGYLPFNFDAWLNEAPEPVREAIELAYWQSVAEAAGWHLSDTEDEGDPQRYRILTDNGLVGFKPTPREAIGAAFGKGE